MNIEQPIFIVRHTRKKLVSLSEASRGQRVGFNFTSELCPYIKTQTHQHEICTNTNIKTQIKATNNIHGIFATSDLHSHIEIN